MIQVLHAHGYQLEELWQDTPLTKVDSTDYEMLNSLATSKQEVHTAAPNADPLSASAGSSIVHLCC
jgi:hypothetical protein